MLVASVINFNFIITAQYDYIRLCSQSLPPLLIVFMFIHALCFCVYALCFPLYLYLAPEQKF